MCGVGGGGHVNFVNINHISSIIIIIIAYPPLRILAHSTLDISWKLGPAVDIKSLNKRRDGRNFFFLCANLGVYEPVQLPRS